MILQLEDLKVQGQLESSATTVKELASGSQLFSLVSDKTAVLAPLLKIQPLSMPTMSEMTD